MQKFQIKYALGGGFGGTSNKEWETIEAESLSDAQNQSYEKALEEYESYVYATGDDYSDIEEEMRESGEEWSMSEIQDEYEQRRESWIEYVAQEYNPKDDPENE